jgi:hypothetical protein
MIMADVLGSVVNKSGYAASLRHRLAVSMGRSARQRDTARTARGSPPGTHDAHAS